MATELELNHIDHKEIYSAIKQIRELKSCAGVNSIHKEIVKVFADWLNWLSINQQRVFKW